MTNKIKYVVCLGILFTHLISHAQTAPHEKFADAANQQAILAAINDYRDQHGLSTLKMNNFITQEALHHSEEMAQNLVPFGHQGFQDRMNKLAQHCRYRMCAENVAYTSEDAKTVVEQWLASSGHRKNIEGNYNLTGIGIAHDKNGIAYVTQIFLNADN